MDLEGIKLLLKVVELGSVQRAAHQLGLPRSSLRRKLDNLQAGIGRELLVSNAVGVALTPAGAVVLEEGRGLLEHYERMVAAAKSTLSTTPGNVRVMVPVGMPDAARIAVLRSLMAITTGMCVEETEHEEPLSQLHERFDLMFHFGEPPDRGNWFSRVLIRARLVPLASEAYLQRHGRPSSVADLAGHRLLSWVVRGSNPREWPLWSGGGVPIEPIFCSSNGQLMHRLAQEGVGVLLGNPDALLLPGTTPLVPLLGDEIGGEITFRCLSPVPSDADPRTRTVLKLIQAFLTSMAPEG